MDKNNTLIMTIESKKLFQNDYFQGFCNPGNKYFVQRILQNYSWTKRGDAENNNQLKQPIAYCILVNTQEKEIFVYQRGSKNNYDEKRLQGKWSWGLGGHIDKEHPVPSNPIYNSMKRELAEEISFEINSEPYILGFINDDNTPVGQVHFGILYIIPLQTTPNLTLNPEISQGSFIPLSQVKAILENKDCNVEEWSKISYEPLKQYFDIS